MNDWEHFTALMISVSLHVKFNVRVLCRINIEGFVLINSFKLENIGNVNEYVGIRI